LGYSNPDQNGAGNHTYSGHCELDQLDCAIKAANSK